MLLAVREIRRAPVRFGLLTAAVGLLVFLIFFQQTLLTNLLGFFTGALEHQSGEVVVYDRDARKNLAGSVVTDAQAAAVAAVAGVDEAGPLGEGTFTTRTANGKTVDGILFGYRLDRPGRPTTLSEGRLPRRDGEGVASAIDRDQGFDIGDTVRIVSATGRPDDDLRIRIVGLADDARFSVQPVVFTTFDTYREARVTADPGITPADVPASAVLANPVRGVGADALAKRIEAAVPGVQALARADAVEALPGVAPVRQSFAVILFLAFTVVTVVTGFFFLILTVQKTAPLTVLKAIGVDGSVLVRALLTQVVLVVLGGLVTGMALLLAASTGSSATFPITLDRGLVLRSGAIVLVLAVAASLVAVRRVLRLDPLDATTRPSLGGFT